jgi:hypothetical protein
VRWVTRARPKTDRIACPWLIRRFIDAEAEFLYVSPDQVLPVAAETGARSYDAPDAEFGHRDGKCTFEVLIEDFDLGADEALVRLAEIVHAADIDGEIHKHPAAAGLLAIAEGGLAAEADDHALLAKESFVYDALYAWCARETSSPGT